MDDRGKTARSRGVVAAICGIALAGGIATSAILLIVVYAAIHFRYRLLPHSLKPTRLYDVVFWVSIVSILMVGVYSFVQSLPKSAATPAPATATEHVSAKS